MNLDTVRCPPVDSDRLTFMQNRARHDSRLTAGQTRAERSGRRDFERNAVYPCKCIGTGTLRTPVARSLLMQLTFPVFRRFTIKQRKSAKYAGKKKWIIRSRFVFSTSLIFDVFHLSPIVSFDANEWKVRRQRWIR